MLLLPQLDVLIQKKMVLIHKLRKTTFFYRLNKLASTAEQKINQNKNDRECFICSAPLISWVFFPHVTEPNENFKPSEENAVITNAISII